jgi:hypothetical protein
MTANVPIRHIDGLEIPTTGTWPAVGASSVVRSAWLRGPRALPVVGGWFRIAEDPTDSSLRIDLDDCMLFATTKRISAGDDGRTEWLLEGFAQRADRHHPLTLSLLHQGVFRRGADAWAWLSGTGTVHTPARRLGRLRPLAGDGRLVVELLFTTSPRTVCFKRPVAASGADSSGLGADVAGGGADELAGRGLLDGVDAPADGAADRERGREHLTRHAG